MLENARPARQAYPTDLTDAEWKILEPLVPPAIAYPNLQEPKHTRREILNAIRYRTRTGCAWRMLPHDFPPWKTVYNTYHEWANDGTMKAMNDALVEQVRLEEGRNIEPTAAIIDSQSVKGSAQGGEYGYDAGKKVKGRKRHLLVDVLGLVLAVVITPASVQDRDGAVPVIENAALEHSNLQKIWADSVYNSHPIEDLKKRTGIDIEVVKRTDDMSGFVVLPRRWVVERTFGWMERFRLLNREYERTVASSTADVYHAMVMIMDRRLAQKVESAKPEHQAQHYDIAEAGAT
jgi:putative transposase